MAAGVPRVDASDAPDAAELRPLVARSLQQRATAIIDDAMAVSAFAGMEGVALADRASLADAILRLIAHAVREGTLDPQTAAVTDLGQVCGEAAIDVRVFFNMVYLMERSAGGELSGVESLGATSETWPVISHMLHRASFDVCAAFSETRAQPGSEITDSLTTLHTRAVFLAALEKEIQRSYRFSRPFALMLIDIDRLAEINATHGYDAGDFVIERVGIVVRTYFRETDWVARSTGGVFAVLLPEIQRADAQRLANRMRITIQERLQLHDYRSDDQFPVTVSVGVLVAETVDQSVQADQLLVEAKEAVSRAKLAGRNCIEHADAIIGRPVPQTREGPSID
jgi:diguanylate cyclase (GGDEF)-like protein